MYGREKDEGALMKCVDWVEKKDIFFSVPSTQLFGEGGCRIFPDAEEEKEKEKIILVRVTPKHDRRKGEEEKDGKKGEGERNVRSNFRHLRRREELLFLV